MKNRLITIILEDNTTKTILADSIYDAVKMYERSFGKKDYVMFYEE